MREVRDPDQTHFELQMASLLPDQEVARLEEKYGDRFRDLPHEDKVVVVAAALEGITHHTRVCELTNQHPADVTKQLGRLSREGFLLPDGRGRGTVYRSIDMSPEDFAYLGFDNASKVVSATNLPNLEAYPPNSGVRTPQIAELQAKALAKYPSGVPGKVGR